MFKLIPSLRKQRDLNRRLMRQRVLQVRPIDRSTGFDNHVLYHIEAMNATQSGQLLSLNTITRAR
jgi:hypothetical protein